MAEYISALYGLYAPEMKTKLEGQGMVEYALILVLVSVVAIVVLRTVGTSVGGIFTTINGYLGGAS